VNNNSKEIAGVRQRFEAYAAGAASGQELRSASLAREAHSVFPNQKFDSPNE
jgi:hypothetical protein